MKRDIEMEPEAQKITAAAIVIVRDTMNGVFGFCLYVAP